MHCRSGSPKPLARKSTFKVFQNFSGFFSRSFLFSKFCSVSQFFFSVVRPWSLGPWRPGGQRSVITGNESVSIQWHSAGRFLWAGHFIFQKNILKQFYRTALGNCYGLKLPHSRLQFKSVHFRSLYIVCFTMASSASYQTVGEQRHADTTFSVECGVGVVALDARMRRREDDARD